MLYELEEIAGDEGGRLKVDDLIDLESQVIVVVGKRALLIH